MENAAEALKIAGFTLLFVAALSVAMITVMQGKNASETIIKYSDKTNYYSYVGDENGEITSSSRIVTVNDIIPTLYRYKQEEYIVLFYKSDESTPLQIFDGDTKITNIDLSKKISYLNYNLEDKMQENWRQNDDSVRSHVNDVVKYLLEKYKDKRFKEEVYTTTNKYYNNAGLNLNSENR